MSIVLRRISMGDEARLAEFYNGLSTESKRTFRPLGEKTTPERCSEIMSDNAPGTGTKYDLFAVDNGEVVGWAFLWNIESDGPTFGLGVADAYQGKGLGRNLMDEILRWADERGINKISLTVVQDNDTARAMYERRGFVQLNAYVGSDGLPYFSMERTVAPTQTKGRASE
jgi:GNAT superfamily N-acetyltransferase